jgi:hypothetical protein
MAMEPLTLFARLGDPAGVAGLLRERVPTVEIDGQDGGWGNAVVTFGTRKLTLRAIPEQGGVNLGLGAPKGNPLIWFRHLLAALQVCSAMRAMRAMQCNAALMGCVQ